MEFKGRIDIRIRKRDKVITDWILSLPDDEDLPDVVRKALKFYILRGSEVQEFQYDPIKYTPPKEIEVDLESKFDKELIL